MLCKAGINHAAAARKNRRSKAVPTLIVLLGISVLFLVKSANAQASADPSAYRLIGTVLAGEFTGAVIDEAAGGQTFYRLHEKLPDGSELFKVQPDSILLKTNDGGLYEIFIAHDTKAAAQQAAPQPQAVSPGPVIVTDKPAQKETFRDKRRRLRRAADEN
jgi:hypothetical protein